MEWWNGGLGLGIVERVIMARKGKKGRQANGKQRNGKQGNGNRQMGQMKKGKEDKGGGDGKQGR